MIGIEQVDCWRRWSRPLFTHNDLRLIDGRLEQLQHAPYFHEGLRHYLSDLRALIAQLQRANLPPQLAVQLTTLIWRALRYLSGSVSREIPYEVVYGLDLALRDWVPQPPNYVITTGFLAEPNYHFAGVPENFYKLAETMFGVRFDHRVVQVALPQLYKHFPLNNSVLYHELGHFVDERFGISKLMLLIQQSTGQAGPISSPPHAAEFFSDLFGACYVGEAITVMIDSLAPDAASSPTHPATSDRKQVVASFLAGTPNDVVTLCNQALAAVQLEPLRRRFSEPQVDAQFDNVRPYVIQSHDEVHGLLLAGQKYLNNRIKNLNGMWAQVKEGDAIRMINDLVEKSLRNWMIRERW